MKYVFQKEIPEIKTMPVPRGDYISLDNHIIIPYYIHPTYGLQLALGTTNFISHQNLPDFIEFLQGVNDYLNKH